MAKRKGFSSEVEAAIEASAKKHGLNPQAMRAFVHIESSGNPKAQTGSYKGLFMLDNAQFRRWGGKGDIFDPVANADAAGAKLAVETKRLAQDPAFKGRTPTAADIYLVHQQGEGGSRMHRRNPDQPAWKSMFATSEGQQKGEKWAKQAIWGNVPHDVRKQFGSVDNITSRDFMKLWNEKVAKFGGVKSPTELTMLAGAPTQAAQVEVPKVEKQAAVSPEGLLQPELKAEVAAAAPDMTGPLGPNPTPSSVNPQANAQAGGSAFPVSNLAQTMGEEAQPVLPIPSSVETPNAGANPGGGGLFGGGLDLGLKGTIAGLFGLDGGAKTGGGGGIFGLGGKGGGGGGGGAKVSVPDMGNTQAAFSAMDEPGDNKDILPTNIPPPPPPPQRTPQGLPVGNFSEMAKRRRRSQVG